MTAKSKLTKKIRPLAPGGERRFDDAPKTFSVASQSGAEWQFSGIVAILKTEDGTIHLEKTNGNLVEIQSGYVFFELGDPEESDPVEIIG